MNARKILEELDSVLPPESDKNLSGKTTGTADRAHQATASASGEADPGIGDGSGAPNLQKEGKSSFYKVGDLEWSKIMTLREWNVRIFRPSTMTLPAIIQLDDDQFERVTKIVGKLGDGVDELPSGYKEL